MHISVVIVSYQVRYFLEQCILSVLAASKGLEVEIIVVDNNSADDTCEMLLTKYPKVQLIENKENVGFSVANNQGVAIAKGVYVLILNPDTVLAEDTLSQILHFAKSKSNFGALGVKLINDAGNFMPESKRGIPTPQVSFNKLFGISSKRTGKYYATHIHENETGVVEVLSGAFVFLKRTVYNEVGGFDEAFFMYGEDIDLSCKILHKGYQNYYYHNTQVIHYKGESTKRDLKYLKIFYQAMKIFYKKHFRLNKVYDFVMSFGIEFWFLLKYYKFIGASPKGKPVKQVLYFGEDQQITCYLNKNYLLIKSEWAGNYAKIKELIKEHTIDALIFDNNLLSNKEIIQHFQAFKNEGVTFKIRPKNTHFLIGSNDSLYRGEVIVIKGA